MNSLWPFALALLLQVSLILLAGVALHRIAASSPAARHAVLLWTLIAAASCPALALALRAAGIRPLISLGSSLPRNPAHIAHVIASVDASSGSASAAYFPLPAVLLLLWAAGTLFSLMRLTANWLAVRRIRATAAHLAEEKLALLANAIRTPLGQRIPPILSSRLATVPMAVGCWRPIVLIPPSALDSLDAGQLAQVLMHECVHAIRRDALVGLFQRVMTAAFWFHPLIHLVNRRLDRSREEICDNYALRISGPRAYSRTLLAVAQSISLSPYGRLAPSLYQPGWSLEDRVAGLLNQRRCLMTKLTPGKSAVLALGLLGGSLAFSCFAGSPQSSAAPQNAFSEVIPMHKPYAQSGDSITVEEVRGPSKTFLVGDTYEVSGTYELASQDTAMLAAFVTISSSEIEMHAPALPRQTVMISRGQGRFTLQFHMWQKGDPHVSFYPAGGGNSFGGVYF